jgi:RecG-like helicase
VELIISGKRLLTGKQLAEIKISHVPGIGEKRARLFHKIGIYNLFDLLYYLPRRYEDRRVKETLNDVEAGEVATVLGTIENIEEVKLRRNLSLLRVAFFEKVITQGFTHLCHWKGRTKPLRI